MERLIDKELKQWKEKKDRKVLLLRGARQVGKTYSIRKLSKTFKKFLEINFEETAAAWPRYMSVWNYLRTVRRICGLKFFIGIAKHVLAMRK